MVWHKLKTNNWETDRLNRASIQRNKKIDYREFEKIMAPIRITGISGFWRKEQKQKFSNGMPLYMKKAFNWDLDEKKRTLDFFETSELQFLSISRLIPV